ncbi:hypothetical protein PLICRDRAFT_137120, partial [Plicaturopsis crispa FD-325 SS-3]
MAPHPLSLKQRLAALSLAPSSPSSPIAPDSPKSPRRKNLFSAPWGRRNGADSEEPDARDRVQEAMTRLIWQAGVDYETRPMVVLNASALPDPREVNYDLLLSRILSYLNLYVESDYTVVFFAAGGRHTPGWNWVWKAYRSLSRKYRKNLKRLFIVHSNFFSKMLFSLAGAIISPKFFRKIIYIDTLSDLASQVPLTQIDIPRAVYEENLKHEKQIILPVPSRSDVFGVPLEDIMGYHGEKGGIPRVVKDCIQYLRDTGMEEEGLFRRSPNSVLLRQAQEAYDRGQVVTLESFGDPHLAAVLLKKYLRDLPEPIIPESLYPVIRRCPTPTNDPGDMSGVSYIRDTILVELPPCVYILLSHYLHLMHEVSLRAASNRMDAHNLSVVLCPNLLSGSNPAKDVMMCTIPGGPTLFESSSPRSNPAAISEGKTTLGMVIKLCIQRYYEVFDEVLDRSEAIPPQPSYHSSPDASSNRSSSPRNHNRASYHDDDEDIDDAMLVMPIGPSGSGQSQSHVRDTRPTDSAPPTPPSAWNTSGGPIPYKPRIPGSKSGTARSVHTTGNGTIGGAGFAYASQNKAKSMISIENAVNGVGTTGRRGSISVGRGTTRKSSGAGVEAMSVTASGFFSAPS